MIQHPDQYELECAYCTGYAAGFDEDGEPTCGDAETCMIVVTPLPAVIEQSCDDDEEDESEDKQ